MYSLTLIKPKKQAPGDKLGGEFEERHTFVGFDTEQAAYDKLCELDKYRLYPYTHGWLYWRIDPVKGSK